MPLGEYLIEVGAFLAAGAKLAAVLRMKLHHPVHDDNDGDAH
jgi:hypothetical protein